MENKIFGLCSKCHEMTSLDQTCCGEPIWFEGELIPPDLSSDTSPSSPSKSADDSDQ